MRILASNPDSIGDIVLRQPLYAALQQAGHQLTLIVRPTLLPIMPLIAPGADVLVLPLDPYAPTIDWHALINLTDAAIAFDPDLLLIASYQWTPFEEHLAASLPGVRRIGFNGRLFPGDPRSGVYHNTQMTLDVVVEVAEETSELHKNELLCSAVLGRHSPLSPPRIHAGPEQLRIAETLINRFGLQNGQYWVACVGHTPYTLVRNWGVANWSEALSYWARTYNKRFLLIGSESEAAATTDIADAVQRQAPGAAQVAQSLNLDALVGITQLSAGYIGRDTGPMHIAAACVKPVLAVFGGGTWPRFLPAAIPSRVLTVKVPCAGCDWICHLPESHCVKSVTVADVCRAIDDMEAGRITTAEVQAPEPDVSLVARMLRESAISVRDSILRAARAEAAATKEESLKPRLIHLEERLAKAAALNQDLQNQLSTVEVQAADLQVKDAEVRRERDILTTSLRHAEQRLLAEQQATKSAIQKIDRLSQSRWYQLGRKLGLKLESNDPQPQTNSKPAQVAGRQAANAQSTQP